MIIRPFEKKDKEELRSIACETAFLELPYHLFVPHKDILADALTLYFTDYEPESCFVGEEGGKIIGYIIGTKNIKKMNSVFNLKILPALLKKILFTGILFHKQTFIFLWHLFLSAFKGEFFAPDFSRQYPALLHINIDKIFRQQKNGEALIKHFTCFLKENNISGVHLGTMSEKAKDFFQKNGFMVLFQGHRSYLKYYLKSLTPYYILGRQL